MKQAHLCTDDRVRGINATVTNPGSVLPITTGSPTRESVCDEATVRRCINGLDAGPYCLIVELANMRDEGTGRFRKLYPEFSQHSDAQLMDLRQKLLDIWNPEVPVSMKEALVQTWRSEPGGWTPMLLSGVVLPTRGNLAGRLACAVLQDYRRLAKCENPECVAPFFLKKRRSQKFCERGECTAYAQRQYALKWWRHEGQKRRKVKWKT